MIQTEDWDKLYYAIVRIRFNKKIELVGIGSTKLICRNSAMGFLVERGRTKVSPAFIRLIENLDLGVRKPYYASCVYSMVYCEAKVYIYGKRYGDKDMKLVFDPTYQEDLVRFAGYDKKPKE